MKYLIINADDFGMSKEVNEGIQKGIDAGIITSVSVMVNMPYFNEAMTILKKYPHISVGLHFNITEGFPVLPRNETTTLIREGGNFFYWSMLIISLFFRKISTKQIETELQAQYNKLKEKKVQIRHIDSHHHIHLYPQLFKIITDFVQRNKVKALRCRAFNPKRFFHWIANPPTFKQFIIILLCVIDSFFFARSKQFYDVNNLYDIAWDDSLTVEKFCKFLRTLPDGTTEVICHPAVMSETGNEKFLRPRSKGLALLLNKKIRDTIKKNDIQLITRIK